MTQTRWPRLRCADNRDCPGIAQLVFAVLREYNLAPDPETTDADLKDIEGHYLKRGGAFYVLEDRPGSIIGAYGLYRIDEVTCELRKMYLDRSFRGRGLGKSLLEDALEKAKQLGFKKVTLETASVLTEAISLYRSYGFVEYQPEHLSRRCDRALQLELK